MMGSIRGIIIAALVVICLSPPAFAQEVWKAEKIDSGSVPREIVPESRRPAPGGLPHALIATGAKSGDIGAAWYAGRTERYQHGILGDAIEGTILRVATNAGRYLKLTLPATDVFEDRYPRLADLDGDGTTEIVTIQSSTSLGASVTVYGLRDGKLAKIATTGFIGRTNRWLNIAGIAGFRGRRGKEIAYVQTPHIGGTLFFYAFENEKLIKVGEKPGFSNHVIGSTEMRLSAVADINGDTIPDLALPSVDRRDLRVVGFNNGRLIEHGKASLPTAIDKAVATSGAGRTARFIVGLRSGDVYSVGR